ncbi:glycosyltransferase family 4 protein [Acinetobacter calcoaceticus]|uniref:glycosyltransferase family 4 protein n=1 Tax=Acinetobacter calcoaceticus TaxID=471 RepID=UPI003AF8714C
MKKICFLIGNMNLTGGTEKVTSLIANSLSELENSEILILNIFEGDQPAFAINPRVKLFTLFSKKKSMKTAFLLAIWKIRKFILQHEIDTLIVVDSISCVFTVPALVGLKVKHICWEHFSFLDSNSSKFRELGRSWAALYCDEIVTLTERDRSFWYTNIKKIKANIVSISNPSPYEVFDFRPNINKKIFLAVGRLRYVKGFDLLIQAWAEFCKKNDNWTLRIVGSGEEEENLKALANKLEVMGRIEFIPATKNIDQFYKNASYLCVSSRFEGFGMVILEALSYGLPVVSFNCEVGPIELIDEKIGCLVPKGDYIGFSKKMLDFSILDEDVYSCMSYNSILKAQQYSITNIRSKWMNIL